MIKVIFRHSDFTKDFDIVEWFEIDDTIPDKMIYMNAELFLVDNYFNAGRYLLTLPRATSKTSRDTLNYLDGNVFQSGTGRCTHKIGVSVQK